MVSPSRSRPTEIIRYHILVGRRAWRNSVDLTRRIPQSRPVSRSTQPCHLPRPRRLDGDERQTRPILAQLEPIFEGMRKAGVPEQ